MAFERVSSGKDFSSAVTLLWPDAKTACFNMKPKRSALLMRPSPCPLYESADCSEYEGEEAETADNNADEDN